MNDIAIITLDRIITSPYVKTICVPKRPIDVAQKRDKGYVAGWGLTSNKSKYGSSETKLRYAKLDIYSRRDCREKYSRFIDDRSRFDITDDMVCGGNTVTDACKGDSGGPLMYNTLWTDLKWQVYGIVSFGPSVCASSGLPGVFTRVDKYYNWIQRNVS